MTQKQIIFIWVCIFNFFSKLTAVWNICLNMQSWFLKTEWVKSSLWLTFCLTSIFFLPVLEYVEGKWVCEGSGPPGGLGESTAREYLRDIVSGLMYLHDHVWIWKTGYLVWLIEFYPCISFVCILLILSFLCYFYVTCGEGWLVQKRTFGPALGSCPCYLGFCTFLYLYKSWITEWHTMHITSMGRVGWCRRVLLVQHSFHVPAT